MNGNKVVPTGQNGGGGIKTMAIKLFGSVTDQFAQRGVREDASVIEPEPFSGSSTLHAANSSDYLEEIAEIQQLLTSQGFRDAQEEDPCFTILHHVALLGRSTLAEAIESSAGDAVRRFSRMARYLVRRGHEVYVIDKYGCIPLQIAVSCGNLEMVTALMEPFEGVSSRRDIKRRAEYLNHQDTQIRFTALHGAVSRGQHGTAILLLEAGGNPQILDITRSNAFQVAPSQEALQELLRMVVQHEDDVPTPAIAQLMIEVIKQQEASEKKDKADKAKASAVATQARGKEEDTNKAEWTRAMSQAGNMGGLDYTQRMLFMAINNLVNKMGPAGEGGGGSVDGDRDPTARSAREAGGEVGAIIKRLFKELYQKGEGKHADLWEYVQASVAYNNYKLSKMMLDLICAECPRALASCNWEATMGPLIACFPDLFHNLIIKLQDMSDYDVVGFVRSLRLTSLDTNPANMFASHSALPHMGGGMPGSAAAAAIALSAAAGGGGGGGGGPLGMGGAGLGGAGLLLGGGAAIAPPQPVRQTRKRRMSMGNRPHGGAAAHQGKILIYQQLVEGLSQVNYVVVKSFFEKADQQVLLDMAQFPIFKDFVMLIADKRTAEGFTDSDSGRARLLDLLRGIKRRSQSYTSPAAAARPNMLDRHKALSMRFRAANRSIRTLGGIIRASDYEEEEEEMDEAALAAEEAAISADLAVQTLNVERVLWAAVAARKSMNVEATVRSITSWVNLNSKDRKAVFVTGISTDLLKELAMRFPSACAKLLSVVSRDVMEQLVTLQVSASLLYHQEQLVKCSNVRNHFTWRAPELQHLADKKGYNEAVVDALADYGIPFECTYKAAVDWNTSKEHFAALIDAHFTGLELKELVSNGILLSKVCDMLSRCAEPPEDVPAGSFKAEPITVLVKDMLREKLSFRITEAILEAGSMNEATVYTNFRPGNPLYNTYPLGLYKPIYTHHFVQLLLTNWRRGAKDAAGNWTLRPWDKKFIDTIFAPNDPLCTALKSAYDNKLKDTQVYVENSQTLEGWAKKQRQNQVLVLNAFVCNRFLLHRWPVFVLMHAMLLLREAVKAVWRRLGWEWETWAEHQGHSVDARALVIPWRGIADMGSERGMLVGLIDVDVPVRWFGFAAVKAAITVQWQEFGQMLMLMSAVAHIIFMALFGGFLLVLRNAGEQENADMTKVRRRPEVMALMLVLGLLSIGGLSEEVAQMMELTWRTWRNYLGNLVDLTSFGLFVVMIGMVWASYTYDTILAVGAVETLVLFIRLVFFASMTDSMGSLMRMVIEIIKDMRYFFLLLGMIFGGFAIAFAVLLGPANNYEVVAFKLFSVILGDWQYDYLVDMLAVEGSWFIPRLSVILMSLYGILMLIVLVNLLIAIMNDTYDRIKETEEIEVLHNRARLIVDLESLLTKDMRIQLQERLLGDYLHVLIPAEKKINKFMASSESTEGEWKGRMRAFSDALKRDVDPHLREIRDKNAAEFKSVHADLDLIKKWVEQQKRVLGNFGAAEPGGPDERHGGSGRRR